LREFKNQKSKRALSSLTFLNCIHSLTTKKIRTRLGETPKHVFSIIGIPPARNARVDCSALQRIQEAAVADERPAYGLEHCTMTSADFSGVMLREATAGKKAIGGIL
jgi:hypothetical protein